MADPTFGHRQFDEKPDWILDDVDDYHRTETSDPQVVGLRSLLVSPQEKTAQLRDASQVFLSFKQPFPAAGDLKKTAMGGGLPALAKSVAKPALRSAAEWGAAGAVTGALASPHGHHTRGAILGGLTGGAGGAVAPMAGNLAGKALAKVATPYDETLLMDMASRGADKYPEKVNPFQSFKTDVKDLLSAFGDRINSFRSTRAAIANPVEKQAVDLKALAGHVIPRQVMTGEGLGAGLAGAGIGGLLAYLSSRPQESLGGQSRSETDLKRMKATMPENPDGIGGAVKKHLVNMHSDVAEQMRKHPVAATMAGAGSGALIATRLAALAGLGSHIK